MFVGSKLGILDKKGILANLAEDDIGPGTFCYATHDDPYDDPEDDLVLLTMEQDGKETQIKYSTGVLYFLEIQEETSIFCVRFMMDNSVFVRSSWFSKTVDGVQRFKVMFKKIQNLADWDLSPESEKDLF